MKTFLLSAAFLCVLSPTLHAQVDGTDPQYRAICREALGKPFTPPAPDPALKPDCDAASSYYGIGRPVDYAAARSCALAEYTQSASTASSSPLSGAGILSMIYANGQGVPADLDLATRFTCENEGAPAEIETRLDILTQDRENHTLAKFDLCETATSGNSEGWCESLDARRSDIDRNRKLDAFRAVLPAAATQPFEDLQKAEEDFVKLRTDSEVDLSGSARSAFQLEEQNDLRDQFLADLLAVTTPSFHEDTAFPAANKKLNGAYKPIHRAIELERLPRASKTIPNTTIAYKGIEDTQRSWLHLRDTWMAFAAAANPEPNAGKQAASLVTLERTQQLNELAPSK